ncbi:LysR family transcriptional regulator [Pseudomonas entomophila]|uniref:LysR family transcriptional regulator n=1 Tax=Pseudomonas entomophila TaxID=312306 RepID=UPI0023D81258|nr:LysR family transcriptional regulator [Pseudomonas entomophila]MDF0732120.1 LysR family transcriptional regulator [Pseudomonas entomophila]
MKKRVRMDDLQVFVSTVEAGGLSAAARQLDISPALASAALQRLERALGIRLLVRSTRRLRLSDDGERYLPHARQALAALGEGEMALEQARDGPAGPLRLSLPSDLGRNVLLPWLDAFQAAYPQVQLQLRISDQVADLFSEHLDASIRYGLLADSSLVSLPLAPSNRRTLCAAPAYLARHGVPQTLAQLAGHNCLRYVMGEQTHDRWSFQGASGVSTVQVEGDRCCDDADIVRRWAVAGLGVVYKSRLDVLEDIRAGRLVELLPGYLGQPAPLQMVCPHRHSLTPAIRLLQGFLLARLEAYLG